MSWLYNHREQLGGYQLHAEVAYRFRHKVLPEDGDDIEQDIIIQLKAVTDKKDQVSIYYLYGVARNVVRRYWRKKYREWRKLCHIYEGEGVMIANSRKLSTLSPDISTRLDAIAVLKTLPERLVKVGAIRAEGGKLNNADRKYLDRQRHKQFKNNHADAEKIERMRQLYVDEGLSCTEVAEIVGMTRTGVQRNLNKLGVIRPRGRQCGAARP